ncbi:MAG: hypothetical protein AVDCRST_MAG30-4452 [uncultured Solirubrobacteraceae bacterium]|uniref:Uncharacterized protein n=1 Tax=uncultured Solirubrobacteraceae bacterium TaxID=1162706 RepID=A0A6J4U1I7_9ACTN|nr:MAG: hypothetical protein AVDCRST_MAG30-4452 [uncultured Solirubrobacteraceae bacterium]
MSRRYGAGPAHLLVHVAALALIAWAVLQISDAGGALTVALWFAGAVIVHDFVLLPLYAGADRALQRAGRAPRDPRLLNHLRIPLALSTVTLLAFAPLILGRGDAVLARVSTIEPTGYLGRWLLLTAALLAGSGIIYLIRRTRGT